MKEFKETENSKEKSETEKRITLEEEKENSKFSKIESNNKLDASFS